MPEKAEPPAGRTWATPCVSTLRVKEGNRERIQVFEGTVIAKKHGGIEETFTVRRISYGVGVEKVFPLTLPVIEKVETVRHEVRSAGLSCTICVTAWVRLLRSRKSFDLRHLKEGAPGALPLFKFFQSGP